MGGARSHEELIVWQLAYQLKLGVYDPIRASAIKRNLNLHDQLRNAAGAVPRLVAEGFGRYLPGDFARYLRAAHPSEPMPMNLLNPVNPLNQNKIP